MRFQLYLISTLFLYDVSCVEFSYRGATGPVFWPKLFPSCNGSRQSPLALKEYDSVLVSFQPFVLNNYHKNPSKAVLFNNDHTAQVMLTYGRPPTITGGGLPGVYQFTQYHFHWGSDSSRGSEHTLNGIQYPMEMHVVHFKTEYGSAANAITKSDGIAVFSILFEVAPFDNPILQPLVEGLAKIREPGSTTEFSHLFPILRFLPKDGFSFYRYWGSLTTPECLESTIWTIFVDTIPISEFQLRAFRKLKDAKEKPLVNNFRPTQKRNTRIVFRSELPLVCPQPEYFKSWYRSSKY